MHVLFESANFLTETTNEDLSLKSIPKRPSCMQFFGVAHLDKSP